MPVLLVDVGLFALLLGVLCVVKPLHVLGIRKRGGGAALMAAGLALAVIGAALPAPLQRSTTATRIDDFAPAYQFDERHSIRVQAPRDRVFHAIKAVAADEILFFRTLTWMRSPHLPGRGPESILNVGPTTPILEAALRGGFTDAATTRRFAAYWRVIYPGSALIRRMWLRAIKRRAESVR